MFSRLANDLVFSGHGQSTPVTTPVAFVQEQLDKDLARTTAAIKRGNFVFANEDASLGLISFQGEDLRAAACSRTRVPAVSKRECWSTARFVVVRFILHDYCMTIILPEPSKKMWPSDLSRK